MVRVLLPLLLVLAVAAAGLAPAPAQASEQTGSIRGAIADSAGNGIEGARIVCRGPELLGERVATSKAAGAYWLPALPPGKDYQLLIEVEGYRSQVVRGIRISIGRSTPVDVTLQVAVAEETVVVTDTRPTLDTSQTDSGTTVTKEFLQAVPTSRSYQNTAQLAPGVTGGANPNVRGGASNENAWLLDGINVTDPVTGTFSFNFPFEAIEEVEIKTGSFAAEYGDALGGIINVRTESGSNQFETTFSAHTTNGELSPRRDGVYDAYGNPIEASEYDRTSDSLTLSALAGGPIVKDKAWFFGVYNSVLTQSTQMGVVAPRRFRGHLIFAKLSLAPSSSFRFELTGFTNPTTIDNIRQVFDVPPETEAQQAQGGFVLRGLGEWFIGDTAVLRASYSFQKEYIEVTPMPCTWDPDSPDKKCEEGMEEGTIDFYTPGRIGVGDAEDQDNYSRYTFDDRFSHQVDASIAVFVPDLLGTHELKAGVQPRWTLHDQLYGYPGNTRWYDIWEVSGDPSSRTNYYWVEYPGQFHTKAAGFTLGAYLQDTWKPIPNLTFNVGARYERMLLKNDVGEHVVDTHLVVPRFGASWDPFNKGRTSLYAAFGVFGSGGRLSISEFVNKNGFGYKLYLGDYFGENTNYSYEQYAYQPTQYQYDSASTLTAPRSYEVSAGVRQAVWEELTLSLEFDRRWFRYLWEDDEVNLIFNEEGSEVVGTQTGILNDLFRLRTAYYGLRDYWSLTFAARQKFHRNFTVDASLTYSSLQGRTETALTVALDNATQFPVEYGYLSADRAWVGKLAGAYFFQEGTVKVAGRDEPTPWGTTVGLKFTYSSGSRFDRRYYSSKVSGYDLYRTNLGSYDSLDPYALLDLRISQGIPIPGAGVLQFVVEGTNLFNNRQATGISQGSLDAQGEIEASNRISPFSLNFGLIYAH